MKLFASSHDSFCFFFFCFPWIFVVNHHMLVLMCCRSLKCRCNNFTKKFVLFTGCLRNFSSLVTQDRRGRSVKQALEINR